MRGGVFGIRYMSRHATQLDLAVVIERSFCKLRVLYKDYVRSVRVRTMYTILRYILGVYDTIAIWLFRQIGGPVKGRRKDSLN